MTLISDPVSTGRGTRVPPLPAAGAGLLAAPVCALLGTAVGALTAWPVLRSPGRAVPALLLAAVPALVASGSPARAAVGNLVSGSRSGAVPLPLLPLAGAAVDAVRPRPPGQACAPSVRGRSSRPSTAVRSRLPPSPDRGDV
ncbi:hypothetical protein STENM327S_06890 [Streptomyces tendae]